MGHLSDLSLDRLTDRIALCVRPWMWWMHFVAFGDILSVLWIFGFDLTREHPSYPDLAVIDLHIPDKTYTPQNLNM